MRAPALRPRLIAATAAAVLCASFTTHAAIASFDQQHPLASIEATATGYEAAAHFTGALLLDPTSTVGESRTSGATGTAMLPALPAGAALTSADASVRAAAPFRSGGNAIDRARALQCLTAAIYYEAASEPDDGQRAVAQVVLNRVRHPAFPATICGVVYQGSERRGCQFSFACDGAMARAPVPRWWNRARSVAARALAGEVFAPVGLATHYHTYAVTPAWNRGLVMTGVFGAHFFHRWKGWWGTSAAFRDRYAGGEPVAGPHVPSPAIPAAPIVAGESAGTEPKLASLPQPVTPIATGEPAVAAAMPPASQVLDRWKDSGTPLR